ncbi:MAG: hypothetical protein R3323_06180 [Wenzhouxiangellaceae bacterium]|nr:hypothetical protein [Wenzhouxiangellaceae bacterium]
MDNLLDWNRWLHIVAGFAGLAAFWIPVFVRKGGELHRYAGRVFRYSAFVVLTAAGLAVLGRIGHALATGTYPADNPEAWAFLLFLGYLALVTGGILSHGIGVLAAKRDLTGLDTPYRRLTAWSMIAASIMIVFWALYWRPDNAILLLALSPIGIGNGIGILNLARGRNNRPGQWKIEHLNAMLGCGIAFHTAFAVFGANRFFSYDIPGAWQILPWIAPAAIGIPASALWARYYRRRLPPVPA